METIIRLRLSELTEVTLGKIKSMLSSSSNNSDPQISITIDSNDYSAKLNQSIEQIKSGNALSFTMEEMETYITKNFKD